MYEPAMGKVASSNNHIKIVRYRSLGRRTQRGAPYVKRYVPEFICAVSGFSKFGESSALVVGQPF